MTTEKQHALYMANPDTGTVELIHAEDVGDRKGAGYKEPTGMKANGTSWNTEDDEAARNIAAENAKVAAKSKAEKDDKKSAELTKAYEANLKAAAEAEQVPDMKVAIVPMAKEDKPAKSALKSVSKAKGAKPAPRRR